MSQVVKWLAVFLLNALIGYLSSPLVNRTFNTSGLYSFANTGTGGNSLLIGIVFGVAASFLFSAQIPSVKAYREKWLAWFAGLLRKAAAVIHPEVS